MGAVTRARSRVDASVVTPRFIATVAQDEEVGLKPSRGSWDCVTMSLTWRRLSLPQTLGDEHPVTEESLQALAAAGGSISPKVRSEPNPVTPSTGHAVDPPPPSLECLASFKTGQEQERQVRRVVSSVRIPLVRCW